MRPSRIEMLRKVALAVSERGTCSRAKVGAVAARDGRILVTGYNGAPAGMPHCEHYDEQPCQVAVHAEANLVAYAARWGISLEGADLVTTHSPCLNCAQLIINAGFVRVIYTYQYRVVEPLDLLRAAGVILQVDGCDKMVP